MTGAFSYRAGMLCVEDISLEKIAAETGTPFYCYSTAQLQNNYREFSDTFDGQRVQIYYAVKACPNQAVIRTLALCGAGADVTSAGELERALLAGIGPEKIVFSGVGKRRDEITAAIIAGIHQINVESVPELHAISEVAAELKRNVPIALRVNPDIDARTHRKIATGDSDTKFGIDAAQIEETVERATRLPGLTFKGLSIHVGSHMQDYEPFRESFAVLASLAQSLRANGFPVERLDLGGGVGIAYDGQTVKPFADYARIVTETVGNLGCALGFEPGRRLVGDAGVLVSRVTYVKQGAVRRFVVLDAGMNDLLRPALYAARHSIIPLRESTQKAAPADVVGPVCETGDIFGKDYELPSIKQGDLVAILQAGAYGAAMSSNYNGRALVPEILASGSRYAIVRRRIAVAEQISWEGAPDWLPEKPV